MLTRPTTTLRGLAGVFAAALLMSLPGGSVFGTRAFAGASPEGRKQPMQFTWHEVRSGQPTPCVKACAGFVTAVGSITGDTPEAFADFAENRDLRGATIVLDSSGGSVLDAIDLGREWRELGVHTTVGFVPSDAAGAPVVKPEAYCESMCVFLLLAGTTRSVPEGAHVRVHQIWMGDRADDATAASYTAQDVMIIERDVGRLAKYTFEMGGGGDLLGLALSVPPWEPLHELSYAELRQTNLVSDLLVAGAKADAPVAGSPGVTAVHLTDKPIQDRFATTALPDAQVKVVSDPSPAHLGKLAVEKTSPGGTHPGSSQASAADSGNSTRTAEAGAHQ